MVRFAAVAALVGSLSGCMESEQSCAERLADDFRRFAEFAKSEGEIDAFRVATNSALDITTKWVDDDQNACDYYSDGPHLRKK